MNAAFEISTFWTLSVILGGLVVVGMMRGLRRLLEQLRLSQVRRETLRRLLPLVEIIVGLLYVLISVPVILDHNPHTTPIVTAAILLGGVAVLWFAIRDFVHGVILKSSDICRVGDQIQFGDIGGRLTRLDFRVLAIETARGEEILVPYSQVSRQSVVRIPVPDGEHRHGFAVYAGSQDSPSTVRDRLFEAAWAHHWSAISRPPLIATREDGGFDVTVFSLDALHAPEIEAAVRDAGP